MTIAFSFMDPWIGSIRGLRSKASVGSRFSRARRCDTKPLSATLAPLKAAPNSVVDPQSNLLIELRVAMEEFVNLLI